MRKNTRFSIVAVLAALTGVPAALAHCPLCTGAVVVAAASAKYYGLDVSIVGLFVGAFAISMGLWIGRKMKKQYVRFQTGLITLLSFVLTVAPLFALKNEQVYIPVLLFGASGSLFNKIYWIDKLFSGSVLGAVITLGAFWLHMKIKTVRGKVLFPFQGIAMTLVLLIIAGVVLYGYTS